MKIYNKATAVFLLICILFSSFVACDNGEGAQRPGKDENGDSYSEIQDTVTVSIANGDGYTVTSSNPLSVIRGSDATFSVSINDGYEFESATNGAEFSNGKIIIEDVQFPTTVEIFLKKSSGSIEITIPEPEDDPTTPQIPTDPELITVELKAQPDKGFKFICWSLDKPITEGGEVFATEESGSFNIPINRLAVANYVEEEYDVILYRANGGRVKDTGEDFYYQTVSNEHYYLPNTLHQNGTFEKDGYVLMRYTEKPDGSGTYTTLGGNIEPNKNGFAELYLMWAPVTTDGFSFSISENDNGEDYAEIDKYSGNEQSITIPECVLSTKDGVSTKIKVEKINKYAFLNSSITSLTLPVTIREIEDEAFKNCSALKEITLHDNIYKVNDEAFLGCKIPKIYLNAGRLPAHTKTALGMNAYKYDKIRLAAANGEKKIIVFAGSSSRYGFLAEEMQKAFDGEYRVINFGNNSAISPLIYMEAFLPWFDSNDIIIHAPETTATAQLGDLTITYLTFMGSEGMLEIFSYIDMSRYSGFFSSLSVLNQEKRNTSKGVSYEEKGVYINEFTDLTTNKDNPSFQSDLNGLHPFNPTMITEKRAASLNAVYSKVKNTGAKMYLSWAPINITACREEAKSLETHKKFLDKVTNMLDCTVISKPIDYMLENKYFNDSNYHPGPTGAKIRTERLVSDLKAQLTLEKSDN